MIIPPMALYKLIVYACIRINVVDESLRTAMSLLYHTVMYGKVII